MGLADAAPKKPSEMIGGMKQRALACCFALAPINEMGATLIHIGSAPVRIDPIA